MPLPSSLRVSNSSSLRVPHSEDFNFGSGDFTIECWVKFNSWLNDRGIVTKGWPSHTGAFLIYATGDSRIAFYASSNGSSWDIANNQTVAPSITLNTWYHVAVTRSGSTFRTFVNGSLTSSWNNSSSLVNDSSRNLAIGNGDTGSYPIDGWIDGLRISKGVARYTANFVPNPLDPATISSFDDGSRFDKPVGNKGPVVISSAQSKFGGTSAYFDGNSYLSVPGDKAWQLGTDDFTVEAWINPDDMNGTKAIVGNYDGADGGWRLAVGSPSTGGTVNYGPEVSFTATNYGNEVDVIIPGVLEITRGDGQGIYNSAIEGGYSQSSSPANTVWNRCRQYQSDNYNCCVEDANNWTNICNYTTRTYGNWRDYGIVRSCYSTPEMVGKELIMKHVPTNRYWAIKFTSWQSGGGGAFSYTRKEILGCTVNSSIVQFRNGNTTIVEKEVSPPLASGTWYHLAASRSSDSLKLFLDGNELGTSAVDPYYSNVSLLLHMDGVDEAISLTDSSLDTRAISVHGTAKLSTAQSKFGATSLSLGTDGAISVASDSDLQLGTSDFTIEAWIYLDVGFDSRNIMDFRSSAVGSPWVLAGGTNGMSTYFAVTASYASHSTGLAVGQWTHIAMTRSGSIATIWVNGVAGTPADIGNANLNGQALWIGDVAGRRSSGYPSWGGGFIDEIRITKGIARYTSNFTPPSSSFPNQGPFTDNINRINSNGLTVGASRSSSNSITDNYKGYIDDLRITKGISRYTSSFTKPAAPAPNLGPAPTAPSSPSGLAVTERDNIFKVSLTPPTNDGRSPITAYNFQYSEDGSTWNNLSVVSDPYYDKVSLLLPMTGTNNSFDIIDDSKHNHNVSIVGDTKITTSQGWFSNGSVVFDGSNDNLVIENNSAFDLRNQDWTIEGWIRPTGDWSKYNTVISKRGNGGSEGTDGDWQLYLRQSTGVLSFYTAVTGGQQESSAVPYANVWNHVAVVRSGRIITLYLNGISVLNFVADTVYNTNRKVYVGGWPAGNEYFYGHMNDIRITKGVARYTSNFDPRSLPQAPANRITGLSTIGTPYTFRARSVNAIGASNYSSSTTSAISTLGAPTNLNVIPDSDRAYLSWTAPTANNSAIKDYSVQYSSDNGSTWTDYIHSPSISTSIVVDGLTVGTSYSFRVAAINIAGTGSYVSTVSPTLTVLREDNTYNKTRLLLHLDSN